MSALSVKCPACGAKVGKQCRAPSAQLVSVRHLGRSAKANAAIEEAMNTPCAPHASRIAAAHKEQARSD